MGDEVTVSVEYDYGKIRSRLRAELIKQGQKFIYNIPARLLLIPGRERRWRYVCQRYSPHKGEHLLEKKIMMAITTLHPPIHRIVQQIESDELERQGMRWGLGAVAWKIIHEWECQGRPKPDSVKIGKTLVIMNDQPGLMCLKTERRKGESLYVLTKIKKTKEKHQKDLTDIKEYKGIR